MTEIDNNGGSTQVLNLKPPAPRSSGSDSVERKTTPAPTPTRKTETGRDPAGFEPVVPGTIQDSFEKAAELLEEFIPEAEQLANTRLRIDRDDETGRFIYLSVDDESGEVIRQFPPENIIKFLSYYRGLEGLLLDDTV